MGSTRTGIQSNVGFHSCWSCWAGLTLTPLQNAQNEPNGIGSIVRLQTNSPRGPDLNCSVLIRDHNWWSRSIYIASIASHCVNEPRKILGNCKLNIVHFAFPQFHASVDCQMRSVNLQRKAVRSFMLQWGIVSYDMCHAMLQTTWFFTSLGMESPRITSTSMAECIHFNPGQAL